MGTDSFGEQCDFCGKSSGTNIRLTYEEIVEVTEAIYPSIPQTVLCKNCAEDVSNYLQRKDALAKSEDDSPFTESDANDILRMVKQHDDLILQIPNHGDGYRYIEGDWIIAMTPFLGPAQTEVHDQNEVRDMILSSPQVSIRQADEEAWEFYEF